MTNNEQETPENSQELSPEELEQQRILLEQQYAAIRNVPHKIVDGIPVALTPEELEEFNREDPNQEAITLELNKNHLINLRKKYLSDTDWYLIRESDQPQSYPTDVRNRRIQAREEINLLQSFTALEQLEPLISNF